MTEIPEHLLKRAAARRAAMAGGDAPAEAPATRLAARRRRPAAAAAGRRRGGPGQAQAPLPTLDAEPAPAVPDSPWWPPPSSRKRVPFWAAPVLALLPLWAFIYVYAVQPPPGRRERPARDRPGGLQPGGAPAATAPAAAAAPAGAERRRRAQDLQGPARDGPLDRLRPRPRALAPTAPTATRTARAARTNVAHLHGPACRPSRTALIARGARRGHHLHPPGVGGDATPTTEEGFNAETFEADPRQPDGAGTTAVDLGPWRRTLVDRRPRAPAVESRRAGVERQGGLGRDSVQARRSRFVGRADDDRRSTAMTAADRADVLVVGGGPAGAATAYWLAEAGHDVVVRREQDVPPGEDLRRRAHAPGRQAARRHGPRRRPRADYHRYDGLRAVAHGITLELHVARAPGLPRPRLRRAPPRPRPAGGRARRRSRAPTLRQGTEAVAPHRRGRPGGRRRGEGQGDRRHRRRSAPATWSSPTAPTPASAGPWARPATAATRRAWPSAAYYESPLHDDPWIESCPRRARPQRQLAARLRLDLPGGRRHDQRRHRPAVHLPGLQDGQHLAPHGRVGGHRPRLLGDRPREPPPRRPPAAASPWPARSNPKVGPTWIVVGDAAGSINPFNGEGIDYAYETGPHGGRPARRGARYRRRPGPPAVPASCSRPSTASTSRWPACSPR